jgi:hypothetical protein
VGVSSVCGSFVTSLFKITPKVIQKITFFATCPLFLPEKNGWEKRDLKCSDPPCLGKIEEETAGKSLKKYAKNLIYIYQGGGIIAREGARGKTAFDFAKRDYVR